MGKEFRQSLLSMDTRLGSGATLTRQGLVELRDSIRNKINKDGGVMVTLSRPERPTTPIDDCCALIYDVHLNGDAIEVDVRVMDETPSGELLQNMMEEIEVYSMGVSGRYLAAPNENNKIVGDVSLCDAYINVDK